MEWVDQANLVTHARPTRFFKSQLNKNLRPSHGQASNHFWSSETHPSVVKFGVSKHQTWKHQTHASISRPQTPSVTWTNTTYSIESGVSKHQPITIPRRWVFCWCLKWRSHCCNCQTWDGNTKLHDWRMRLRSLNHGIFRLWASVASSERGVGSAFSMWQFSTFLDGRDFLGWIIHGHR